MYPLISIVTPSLNQAAYLEETILSVLNQSYSNFEYLVMDGGSTDGSMDIINKYKRYLAQYESRKDNGQAAAINSGYNLCRGKLFAYLNADDLLEKNAFEIIASAFRASPRHGFYYGKCTTIDATGKAIKEAEGGDINFQDLLINGMIPNLYQPAIFFNRCFLPNHKPFNESLGFNMDYELLLRLSKYYSSLFIPEPIAKYRIHPHAKSSLHKHKMYSEKLKVQWRTAPHLLPLWTWRYSKLILSKMVA